MGWIEESQQGYKLESVHMQRVQYPKPADEAYRDLVRAVKQIGNVESSSQLMRTVTGTIHAIPAGGMDYYMYVTLQASVIEAADGRTWLEIDARAGTDSVPRPEAYPLLFKALEDPTYTYKPSGCLGVLFLGTLLGVAWYWVA